MTYEIHQGSNGKGDFQFCGTHADWIRCHDAEVINCGPADCGKTVSGVMYMHLVASKYPGEQLAIVRKQYSDLVGTVCVTFKREVLDRFPYVKVYGKSKPQQYIYPNGSCIWLGGLDKPGKTLSAERAIVLAVQAGELALSEWEFMIRIATGRGRSQYPWPRLMGDINPWHPTHWVKTRAKAGKLTLFNSTHRDNPELYNQQTGEITPEGEKRIGRLDNYTGSRLLRLRHGKWAAPEGAIYGMFDEDLHKCHAFPIPPAWGRFAGVDPVGAFVAAVWIAYDPQGHKFHVYREYYEPFGIPTKKHAANIIEASAGDLVAWWTCGGPSERQQRTDYQSYGLPVVKPGISDLWAGIDRIVEGLDNNEIVIHDSCPRLLDEIGGYRRKVNRDGQPMENMIVDKDRYHLLDSLRYALAGPEARTVDEVVRMPVRIR
ncbi:MAG: hypothetical protein GY832_26250 [Chloroflexi bacterium]|nr:hypothetical protein [Chloroflexota bacterium]